MDLTTGNKDGVAVPVMVGLATGIAFVMVFSMFMQPSLISQSALDERIMADASRWPETTVFFSEYPDGKVEVDRTATESSGGDSFVKYNYERIYDNGRINEVRMYIKLSKITGKPTSEVFTECAVSYAGRLGSMSFLVDGLGAEEFLRTTDCAK